MEVTDEGYLLSPREVAELFTTFTKALDVLTQLSVGRCSDPGLECDRMRIRWSAAFLGLLGLDEYGEPLEPIEDQRKRQLKCVVLWQTQGQGALMVDNLEKLLKLDELMAVKPGV